MTSQHIHDRELERLNNLFSLTIDHVETLSYWNRSIQTLPFNILSFCTEADDSGDFYGDAGRGVELPFEAGWLYFLPADNPIRFCRGTGTRTYTLHFNLEFIHGLELFAGGECFREHAPERVERIARLLAEPDKWKASAMLRREIWDFCVEHWPRKTVRDEDLAQFGAILEYAKKHCTAGLTVTELANRQGWRQDVFSRKFTRALGISPHAWLKKLLLQELTRQLYSRRTLKEIAADLGFSSEFYLSKFFTRRTGLSPREFRRRFVR